MVSVGAATDPGAPSPAGTGDAGSHRRVDASSLRHAATFAAFIAIFIGYIVWQGGTFASADDRLLNVHQNAAVMLLALALLVPMVAGQFDLSVAAMATLVNFLVVGLSLKDGWPFGVSVVVCVAVGLVGGLLNGLLVVKVRVNAFIATLGTQGAFLGLSYVYGGGQQISPGPNGRVLPGWFSGPGSLGSFDHKLPSLITWLALLAVAIAVFFALLRVLPQARPAIRRAIAAGVVLVVGVVLVATGALDAWVSRVSWTIGVLLAITALLWVLLSFTIFGRHLRAIGSNAEAARLAGVGTERVTIAAYVLAGLLAAVAGLMLGANQGSASPDAATAYLLPSFAAVFLSTVLLSNGAFKVWGTLMGGIFVIWVGQGLIEGGLPFTWNNVVNGVVLILAVAVGTAIRRNA